MKARSYLGGDFRKPELESEEVRQEGKAANAECTVITVATGMNLQSGGHTSLVPAEGKKAGVSMYLLTFLPGAMTLWPNQPALPTGSEQVFGVQG